MSPEQPKMMSRSLSVQMISGSRCLVMRQVSWRGPGAWPAPSRGVERPQATDHRSPPILAVGDATTSVFRTRSQFKEPDEIGACEGGRRGRCRPAGPIQRPRVSRGRSRSPATAIERRS